MILSFELLGINVADYNGMTYRESHPLVVNVACDWIVQNMLHTNPKHMRNEPFFLGNMALAFTNFITQVVEVPTVWDAPSDNVSMGGWGKPCYNTCLDNVH